MKERKIDIQKYETTKRRREIDKKKKKKRQRKKVRERERQRNGTPSATVSKIHYIAYNSRIDSDVFFS